jgi:hypothetical protein
VVETRGAMDTMQEQLSTQITQTASNINVSIDSLNTKVTAQGETIEAVNSTFDFTADGLIIGKSDSPVKSVLDNQALRFQAHAQDVMVLNGESSTAEMDRLKIGKYRWTSVDGGNAIALMYVG